MDQKFKGIVINSRDYKEKDKLITIYSLEYGKIEAKLVGVKAFKAKLKFAKEPFCFADFVANITAGYITITSAECIDSFHNIILDLDTYFEAFAILDIFNKVVPQNESDPVLFIELVKSLKTLCYDTVKPYYTIIKFLIGFFGLSGYELSLNKCLECGDILSSERYFNVEDGSIVCNNCKTVYSVKISPKAHKALCILKDTPYEKLNTLKLAEESEREAFNILNLNFKERFNYEVKISV